MAIHYKGVMKITDISIDQVIRSPQRMTDLKETIQEGYVVVFPKQYSQENITRLRTYLFNVRAASLEGYQRRAVGVPNDFRLHSDHYKQAISACFNSWSFYPWNMDLFDLFHEYRSLFVLRNLISGHSPTDFLQPPYGDLAARFAVQFYPAGRGYMNSHTDPPNSHQIAIPTVLLSEPGRDYQSGGFYIGSRGERILLDDNVGLGGVVLFHTSMPHGVAMVDDGAVYDPLSSRGRLMAIAAVNPVAHHDQYVAKETAP